MDCCLSGWDDKDSILGDPNRWADPILSEDAEHKIHKATEHIKATQKTIKGADIWAASMNSQIFKTVERLTEWISANELSIDYVAIHFGSKGPTHGDSTLTASSLSTYHCVTPLQH